MTMESTIAELVASTNKLTNVVESSVVSIQSAATQAISSTKNAAAAEISALAKVASDGYKKAIEDASGGRNTVVIDAQGNPNVMVRVPMTTYEDLNAAYLARTGVDLQLGSGVPTMFIKNGVIKKYRSVGKYLASPGAGGGCSVVGGAQPMTSVNYDVAKEKCVNKGANWGMLSVHDWAFISLLAMANNTVPRGNTNYGRSHENKIETGIRADSLAPGDVAGTGRTNTGSGPVAWTHNHSEWGVHDLVGNVHEWLDQMMLSEGQVITTLDNDSTIAEINWHKHAAYFDSPSASTEGIGNVGSPILSGSVINRNGPVGDNTNNYPYMNNSHFAAITKSANYNLVVLLRRLLIESPSVTTVPGYISVRNYGNRFPLRGGAWGTGSNAGLGALYLNYGRSNAGSEIGFRPAFFE